MVTEARIVVRACQGDELKGGPEVWRSSWCQQVRVKPSHSTWSDLCSQPLHTRWPDPRAPSSGASSLSSSFESKRMSFVIPFDKYLVNILFGRL